MCFINKDMKMEIAVMEKLISRLIWTDQHALAFSISIAILPIPNYEILTPY